MSLEQPLPARRVSDLERDSEVAVIQEALGEGRLELAEFDQRLALIYAASTQQELHAATADLRPVPHGTTSDVLTIRATGTSQKRSGPWQVPPRIEIWAEHSSVDLDFAEAIVRSPEIHVDVQARHSPVVMVVPAGWSIDLDEVLVDYGTVRNDATTPRGGAARLRITGHVKHGSIVVRHPRERRRWWPRRRKLILDG
ncbi:MAG: DUF1707 SHOCT-like domain-containing protein [Pseudonocardiaceae bacterium]